MLKPHIINEKYGIKILELDDFNYNVYVDGILQKKVRNGNASYVRKTNVRSYDSKTKTYITESYFIKNGVRYVDGVKTERQFKNL